MYYTDRAWWTVEDAAALLRINKHTLYRAIAADDFPHKKVGPYIKIAAEDLHMRVRVHVKQRTYNFIDDKEQLELPLPAACLTPVRRYVPEGRYITKAQREEARIWLAEQDELCRQRNKADRDKAKRAAKVTVV